MLLEIELIWDGRADGPSFYHDVKRRLKIDSVLFLLRLATARMSAWNVHHVAVVSAVDVVVGLEADAVVAAEVAAVIASATNAKVR